MPHVVVIGAGTAGLTVARQLSQVSGFKVTILEATSRIGGRIRNIDFDGITVDMGASWMHETRSNPLFKEALKQNWGMKYTDKITKYFTHQGEIPLSVGIPQIIREIESVVSEYFHQEKPLLDDEPPLNEFVHEVVMKKEMLLTSPEEKKLAELMYRQVEHFIGLKWSDIPAGEGGNPNVLGRDAYLLHEGYEKVISWLYNGINWDNTELKLEAPVTMVTKQGDQYLVATKTEQQLADFVVCTIPLGALKRNPNIFKNLELDSIMHTIQATNTASLGKVALQFPSIQWDINADSFCVANEETGEIVSIINPFNSTVLVALIGPDLTEKVEADPNNAYGYLKWAFIAIARNHQIDPPLSCKVTDWSQSEYFGCSYSARSIGQTYDDTVNTFIEGAGKLRFAGEHTILDGNGCVHGAYLSGIREANHIISENL